MRYLKLETIQHLEKCVPELPAISTAKIANFITMDVMKNKNEWSSYPYSHLHQDHLLVQAYLQMNFKNHVLDWNGIQKMDELLDYFD